MAKIVILDDMPELCDIMEERLRIVGHDVRTATTGEDAIDMAYLYEPDLLIADWDLKSDYDGFEVAEAFSAARSEIKTIIVSGDSTIQGKYRKLQQSGRGAELGFYGMLMKPFSIERLPMMVSSAVNEFGV